MDLNKPLLIYDGDCGFCKKWVHYGQQLTRNTVEFAPSQEVGNRFPQIPPSQFEKSVVLVLPTGEVAFGAKAIFRAIADSPGLKWPKALMFLYSHSSFFSWISEKSYNFVATHRMFFSDLTYFLFGEAVEPSSYYWTRWFFLRILGVVYFIAFSSLGAQISGLVGSQGILNSLWSDSSNQLIWITGMVASVLLILDVAPILLLIVLWLSYFILTQICGEFLWFQWDSLMLEMGFLALFLAPFSFKPKRLSEIGQEPKPSGIVIFLFRWLLFRVLFFSGWVKLASGDPTWRDLTALSYHFETQPLPTWIGWYLHQLPSNILKILTVLTFVVELGVPFLIFIPRRPRLLAFFILVGFQVLIDLSGNYGFFGWQVFALCLFLLDDSFFLSIFPKLKVSSEGRQESRLRKYLEYGAAVMVLLTSLFPWKFLREKIEPFRIVNHYGVFAVMTTQRNEIQIEGSQDGRDWTAYEFKWKPGSTAHPPEFVEPHMPRLDWQMWFAALGNFQQNPWVGHLMVRLLEGSPPVLELLQKNPFPTSPPRFIRAMLYEYRFTTLSERNETGQWWRRRFIGSYSPVFSLKAD